MTDFNFDQWNALHEVDPEAFETKREAALRQVIDSREDDESRLLLEQTLFRIEMTRRTAKSPLQAALMASNLMWESFGKLQENIAELESTLDDSQPLQQNHLRLIGKSSNELSRLNSSLAEGNVSVNAPPGGQGGSAKVLSFPFKK